MLSFTLLHFLDKFQFNTYPCRIVCYTFYKDIRGKYIKIQRLSTSKKELTLIKNHPFNRGPACDVLYRKYGGLL